MAKYVEIDSKIEIQNLILEGFPLYTKLIYSACIFSIITNIINIAVFSHSSLRDTTYNFMMVVAITDLCYCCFAFESFTLSNICGSYTFICGSYTQYIALINERIIADFLSSCLAIYSISSEIFLTVQRIFIIRNINFLKDLTVKKVGPIIASISAIYYLPTWFFYGTKESGVVYTFKNQTYIEYVRYSTDFGKSVTGTYLGLVMQIGRIVLVLGVLLVLNIVSIIFFHKYHHILYLYHISYLIPNILINLIINKMI